MKKKVIILILIVIILLIAIILLLNNKTKTSEGNILLVGTEYLLVSTENNIDYIINTENIDYTIGDKIKIETNHINQNKKPDEVNAKNIIIISKFKEESKQEENNEKTTNEDITNMNNPEKENNVQVETNYSDKDIIDYFEDLKSKLINYNNEHDISNEIKQKFVTGIDFLFYDKAIGGKTFKELTNSAKLKVLRLALEIDSKIDAIFPEYKDNINKSYQNIKNKIITLYLDTITDICNKDQELCNNAKSEFQDLKEKFSITWEVIKELAGTGLTKLKDWYEIWRYN